MQGLACREITWYASTAVGRRYLLSVPAILPFLYHLLSGESELVVVEAAGALTNLTSETENAKEAVVRCGIFPLMLTRCLALPSNYAPETISVFLRLLRSCSGTPERQTLLSTDNGLSVLTGLITKSWLSQSDEAFEQIVSILWRVLNDTNQNLISQGEVLDRICERLQQTENSPVLQCGIGALVAMCCRNEYNCIKVGQLGIAQWIAEVCATLEDPIVVHRCLLLLLCLCQFDESREIALEQHLLPVVSCWAQYGSTPQICEVASQVYIQLYTV
jgi:hypothetical protein